MKVKEDVSAFEVFLKRQKYFQKLKQKQNVWMLQRKKHELQKTAYSQNKIVNCKPYQTRKTKLKKYDNILTFKRSIGTKEVTEYLAKSHIYACNNKVECDKLFSRVFDSITNPVNRSRKLFEWLLYPLPRKRFFQKHWEQVPLHIKRSKKKYFTNLMSTSILDKILRENYILFSKNLDITSYENDTRETHNPIGRALPSVVWDYFANGCSIRMLNPQTYIPTLHDINATLQEFFGCFIGANSYLTPPNSQGFAPHYDDIEAFILQIEGKKRWKLYKPTNIKEFLPKYSSQNFTQCEIGKPILDTIVRAGDLLYLPRGTIHQGNTIGFDQHSLHITLSIYQKNSWSDFLRNLLFIALKDSFESDIRFRKGLPLHYLRFIGSVNFNRGRNAIHKPFITQTQFLLNILMTKYINIDKAADETAKNHVHDFLPIVLNGTESICSVYEGGERMISDGIVVNQVQIQLDTFIRLSRAHCARLVKEDDEHRLYYSCDNSKVHHEYQPQFLEVDSELVPAIQELIISFPEYVKVKNLPIDGIDKKVQVARDLWEKAIVISKQPLQQASDSL